MNRAAYRPHYRLGTQDRIGPRASAGLTLRQTQLQKAVARKIECGDLARVQCDSAKRHSDGAGIADITAQQSRKPAAAYRDRPRVRHQRRGAVPLERHRAAHEIAVSYIQRRGDKAPTQIDRSCCRDRYAVGVDQINLPFAGDLTSNSAGGIARHAVEDRRAGSRLDEPHCIARAHRKAVPVDDRAVTGLGNGGGCAVCHNARAAGCHTPTLRQNRLGMCCSGAQQC